MGKNKDQKASSTTEVKVPKELQPLLYGQPGGMTPGTWQPPAQNIPGIPLAQAAYPPGQSPMPMPPSTLTQITPGARGGSVVTGMHLLGNKGKKGK